MSKLDEQLINRILDKLDRTHEVVTSLDKKVDLHVQRTEQEFKAIAVLDAQQNELLAEHAQRSDRLAEDNRLREVSIRQDFLGTTKDLDKRVSVLETPWKWILTTKKGLMWLAAIATSVAGIIELIRMISGK